MKEIEAQELNDDGNQVKYSTRCSFEVCISGDRYAELQIIADEQNCTESEALERVLREGFDS